MSLSLVRVRGIAIAALLLVTSYGCARQDQALQQSHEQLESLSSTTRAIVAAWLSGSTSGTFTATALEQTFTLVQKQRQELSKPESLADPRGAQLSQDAERLSRVLAMLRHHVNGGDAPAVRLLLRDIPQ